MTRKQKAFGLALAAAFALCAMVVPAASADEFYASKTPATITGEQEVSDLFTTTLGGSECEEATYHGTMAKSPTTVVTATPVYKNCFVAEVIPLLIDMNGCGYNVTINPVSGSTIGWIDIECVNGGEELTSTVNPKSQGLTEKCTLHVPQQTVGGITFKNITDGGGRKTVTVGINATGISYTEVAGSGLGACKTTTKTQTDGTYQGATIVRGEEDGGSGAIDVYVE